MEQNTAVIITGTAGNDVLRGTADIDILQGLAGGDNLIGNDGHDVIFGGTGNDTLRGNAGNDILVGGEGRDVFFGGTGIDTFIGGEGNDIVHFELDTAVTASLTQGFATFINEAGVPVAETLSGIEQLVGSNLDDRLTGDDANNTLYGQNGDDILTGGGGNDRLYGGFGADIFNGGSGIDTVYFQERVAVTADLNQGRATYVNEAGAQVVETVIDVEYLVGTEFDNNFTGDDADNRLWGRAGDDTLVGGAGDDMLFGEQGDDILLGGSGNDRLVGGEGVDFIDGGDGIDSVQLAPGNAIGAEANLSTGEVVYTDLAGNETVETILNIENLVGTLQDDDITGTDGVNDLRGAAGNDRIDGGLGNDILRGQDGNDLLIGGGGNDTLVGGTGADRFQLDAVDGNSDTISDFSSAAGDRILVSLSEFETDLSLGEISADQFVIGAAATSADNRFVYNSGNGVLSFDADGSGTEFGQVQIARLASAPTLSSSDISIV